MRNYQEKDIRFYDPDNEIEGDFIVGADGDFALTDKYESPRQDITNRVRTMATDWRSHPSIGADLELLEGEPNTRKTGERGELQIKQTLLYDGRFDQGDVSVRAVPTSIYEIDFYVMLNTDENAPVIVHTPLEL